LGTGTRGIDQADGETDEQGAAAGDEEAAMGCDAALLASFKDGGVGGERPVGCVRGSALEGEDCVEV
jgi:hypothetical protein